MGLAGCSTSYGRTQDCEDKRTSFRYEGLSDLSLEIDAIATGATFYLGSRDDGIYAARDLAADGIVHWGWFAINGELIDGGQFNEANVSCQGFQISNHRTLVRCLATGQDEPRAYLFERGRGIVKFWWNGSRDSLAVLSGKCGYGNQIH